MANIMAFKGRQTNPLSTAPAKKNHAFADPVMAEVFFPLLQLKIYTGPLSKSP
jgi:hypothetical protein